MKSLRSPLAAAALLAALAGSAFAQTPPPAPATPASGMPMMHRHEPGPQDMARWQQRFERHMADMKAKLQITPAQEPAWNQFTAAMKPPATPPQRPNREALAKMTTPERIDQMRVMRQQHQAEMDRRADATKAFYAQLSPDQQKRFDEQTARMMARAKQGHHDPEGHHDMHHGH